MSSFNFKKKYNCQLIAFEIDQETHKYLDKLEDDKTKIIYSDFLEVDLKQILNDYIYDKLYIIGNLPYYITTPIIEKIIDSKINPESITIMVQKEVGDRFLASPHTKEYGYITVLLNYWYDMKCYLDELSEDERLRSRQPEESYKPDFSETFTYAHRCSDRAIKFVNQYRDEDFFLTVSYDEPHGPSLCPAPYNTMYKDFKFESSAKFTDSLSDKPLMQKLWAGDKLNASEDEINHASSGLALFLGCNSFVDYEMGRVLNAIHELIPDAMVIYTSDHGDMLGAHRLFSKNAAIYDEVTNIPLIIKGGEKGKVVTAPASHIDIAPTLMDFFGFPVPKLMEGKSMLPQIHDVSKAINHEVYTEFTRYEIDHDGFGGLQMMRGIVTEDHKLAINLLDKDEFYDRINDPDEMVNEIDNPLYLDQIHKLHDKLIKHMNDTRDLYRGYQWSLRPWNKGYVPRWDNEGFTRQREDEEYEPRQLDYDTGLPMKEAVRSKYLYEMGDQNDESAK